MRGILTFGAALLIAAAAQGQRENLEVGDPAPGIDVEGWVGSQGTTITPDGVYVVMFWETAESGSKTIARLDRLMEVFGHKGLEVIVITGDPMETLTSWSQRQPNLTFHIAADRRSATQRAWVRKAGFKDLPVAFIVGKGKIMHMSEETGDDFRGILIQVLTGRFDPKLREEAEPKLREARRARKVNNWRMALNAYDDVIARNPKVFAIVALERLEMLYVDMGQKDEAYKYAEDVLIANLFAKDDGALRLLALLIIENPEFQPGERELDIAMAAANLSLELAGGRDPEALSTAAMVHARRGEYQEAIDLQTRAYFQAMPKEKPAHKRRLSAFRRAATQSSASSGPR